MSTATGASAHPDDAGGGVLGVADARARLLAGLTQAETGIERVALADALGRILARDLASTLAVPSWPNSAMDGYAVRVADLTAEGESTLPVSQRIPAGVAPPALRPGTAARIFTGAPIPEGADAVVMQENCTESDDGVRINKLPGRNNNIRPAGEDIAQGAVVLAAGRRLRPQDLGLAASIGVDRLDVRRRLRVAVLATGDELVPPGQPLPPGRIYNSNGPLTSALLTRLGCEPLTPSQVADTPEATRAALEAAAARADLVLTSGGVSVGDEDHVKAAVQDLGALELWKVAMKPGKPLAFGRVRQTPFIGLPGNPVSLFVTFLLFAAPAIRRLQGRDAPLPEPIPVPAGFGRDRPGTREEYLRVRLESGRLQPYPSQGSGVLSSAVWADGLARVPADTPVSIGDPLDYYPLESLFE